MQPKDTAVPENVSDVVPEWAKALDTKERLFVEGYLQTLNKNEACRYAGWSKSSARRYAHEIFNRLHVREAIETLLAERTGVTKTWVIDQVAIIARSNLDDYLEWDQNGVKVKPSKKLTKDQKAALAEVSETKGEFGDTIKVKTYDRLNALMQLAKLLNLVVERKELSGPRGGPIEVESSDPMERIDKRLNKLAEALDLDDAQHAEPAATIES